MSLQPDLRVKVFRYGLCLLEPQYSASQRILNTNRGQDTELCHDLEVVQLSLGHSHGLLLASPSISTGFLYLIDNGYLFVNMLKDLSKQEARKLMALTYLFAWGDNQYGQLGLGHTNPRNELTRVPITGLQLRILQVRQQAADCIFMTLRSLLVEVKAAFSPSP